ncbi:OmpA family protein [Haloferula sargassicola]|uniref:OmpA-like domain-containing protein n=1 Tax=Haloferula sargassicola TaxID=490096 RepID=A0ABP9UQ06_9BACT
MKTPPSITATLAALLTLAPLTGPIAFAKDTANPESQPVRDSARAAGEESTPVRDPNDAANPESKEVRDTTPLTSRETQPSRDSDPKASPDSEPVRDDSSKASPEARRVEDNEPEASPEATPEMDSSRGQAGDDSHPVQDREDSKASPEARSLKDRDPSKASPDARPLEDAPAVSPTAPLPETDRSPGSIPPVEEATSSLEEDLQATKLDLKGEDSAMAVIEQVLGAEGPVSRAEVAREEQTLRVGMDDEMSPADRDVHQQAVDFIRARLNGRESADLAPEFFRTSIRDPRPMSNEAGETNEVPARFADHGKRYVTYPDRAAIPAVLLASAALDRVAIQPLKEARKTVPADWDKLPESERADQAQVVSYAIDDNSMLSSNDILFMEGSTQLADDHSFAMLHALGDAISGGGLENDRFVIEVHTAAGSSSARKLTQHRAESIARALVREGVDPTRLIPIGHGDTEARFPADADPSLRQVDQRVIIFRSGT